MDLNYVVPVFSRVSVVEEADEEQFQQITASLATVEQEELKQVLADIESLTTASTPMVVDGRPRMLHVSGFIAHEGVNRNRDGFVAEDLETVVNEKRLFKAPYGGMIDVHHDFNPVGFWYSSEYLEDPTTGSMGIMAHGAIWAWRFPDLADSIIAEVSRSGSIALSMSALAKSSDMQYEFGADGEMNSIMRNPVFIATTILLDEEPGDAHARGLVAEDPRQHTNKQLKEELLLASATNEEEKTMIEDLKPLLAESLGDQADAVVSKISSIFETKFQEIENKLAERDSSLEEANSQIATLTAEVESLNTQLEEKEVALQALSEEKSTVDAAVVELEAGIENYRKVEEQQAFEAKKAARLAEISESVIAKLDERDEEVRDAIVTRWASQSDDEWETTKEELSLAAAPAGNTDDPEGSKPLPNADAGRKSVSFDTFGI